MKRKNCKRAQGVTVPVVAQAWRVVFPNERRKQHSRRPRSLLADLANRNGLN